MDRMLYIAMNGAKQSMLAQATNSNNLANANTTGFKADLDYFKSMPVDGPGYATRVYAQDERAGVDLGAGPVMTTGRDLDVAINGDGWIAVQKADGSEAYTRAGDLRVSPDGLLTTSRGDAVMGNGGPVVIPPNEKLEIGPDGTISLLPLGQPPNTLAEIDRIKLVNPSRDALSKGADGLFVSQNGQPLEADRSVRLMSGALEGSNVNPADAMVKMIEYARMFEVQTKLIDTAERNDEASSRLMRMG